MYYVLAFLIAIIVSLFVIAALMVDAAAPHGLSTGGTVLFMVFSVITTFLAHCLGALFDPELGPTGAIINMGLDIMLMLYSKKGD